MVGPSHALCHEMPTVTVRVVSVSNHCTGEGTAAYGLAYNIQTEQCPRPLPRTGALSCLHLDLWEGDM